MVNAAGDASTATPSAEPTTTTAGAGQIITSTAAILLPVAMALFKVIGGQ
jgi:hypothetical protein